MAQTVSDPLSNSVEQIEFAAEILGRSKIRQSVFAEVYRGKRRRKSVDEIAGRLSVSRKQVLDAGKPLAKNSIVQQEKKNGVVAYEQIDFFGHHKKRILLLAGSPEKRLAVPTKRRPKAIAANVITITVRRDKAKVRELTLDDLASFSKVKAFAPNVFLPKSVSEKQFRERVKSAVGSVSAFADWGGEKCDLFTTGVRVGSRRLPTAFAFKGPGTSGTLTPKKMGKNGDQIQRLFETPAKLFVLQYWGEVDHSIYQQMAIFASHRSIMIQDEILYCVIDGVDSYRLWRAYSK